MNSKKILVSFLILSAVLIVAFGAVNIAKACSTPGDCEIESVYGHDSYSNCTSDYCHIVRLSPVYSAICRVLPWHPCCQSEPQCTSHASQKCVGNAVYWFDSCGAQEEVSQTCSGTQACTGSSCVNQNITCSNNSQCGTSGYTGSPYCNGTGSVYQSYITYTCNNAGTVNSSCSNSTAPKLKDSCTGTQVCSGGSCITQNIDCSSASDCGTSGYTGSAFCSGGDVYKTYRTYTCNNAGTASSYCSNSSDDRLVTDCSSNQTCSGGSCVNQNIACSSASDCGTSGYTGSQFCSGNSVYQNYITYTCQNAGTASSYCSNSTAQQLKSTCSGNQTCSNGSCSGTSCTNYSYKQCSGSYLYWYDSCGNQQGVAEYCSNGCSGSACHNDVCIQSSYLKCSGNYLYWYDSCGNQGSLSQYCSNGCYNNSCQNYNSCTSSSYQKCSGNYLYWYDSCGNQQGVAQYCNNGCYNNTCQNYYTGLCTQNSYQRCSGNYLYWYDSCGNQQSASQYCANGCYNNACLNYNNYNNNNYGNCTYHSYKLCVGNSIYWYDSCGNMQDLVQTCSGTNMVCQYGNCTYQQPVVIPVNNYVSHYKIACSAGNLFWYDSLGSKSGLYKNCEDNNSCTLDTCSSAKCSNTIKCDGSTCATGSVDYNTYCSNGNNNNNNNNNNQNINSLSVSFFGRENSTSAQWQKVAQVGSNGTVYFMVSVANNSGAQVDNITISANIPSEISSLGNLQINGVPVSGDIVAGIGIGSLTSGSAKSITFEGKTQTVSTQSTKTAVTTVNVSGATQSDSLSIVLNPSQSATAAVSSTESTSGFMSFLKRWYLWILVGLVLIFLFVVIFRRLSSNA